MEYIGEHLWAGQLGNFFVVLAFVASLLAAFSYFKASNNKLLDDSWKNLGRLAFRVHSLATFGIVGMIFFMLLNNYFEYHYIWHHSSKALPLRYVFSAFWEGQEGSFLLWSFWHVVLGNILIRTSKDWEAPVMTVYSTVQVFISSMVLGVVLFEYKLGSNPFNDLLRENPDFQNIPLFQNPHYLEKLDGRGLNPLLQNYWMTIHPPTLFLGFASTLVPFSYAIAALWKKRYQEWLKPAIPWAVFGVMILGVGVLMGGAWAYEALSFGGFWAWDPVENASLVPWLTFAGAMHLMLVQKIRKNALFSAFFLTIVTFSLILYSTFLTRSGILGDTSVHAFADLGMTGQLLIFLLLFTFGALILLGFRYKSFPKIKEDDDLLSREFWMFVGAFVLFLSAFQIIFETSKPVINTLFDTKMALSISSEDRFATYHSWQIPIATILSLLIAITQFMKYKKTNGNELIKKLAFSIISSIIITGIFIWALDYTNAYYILMLFSTILAITANVNYIISILKGQIKKAGPSIAHIGFGMILLGALVSTSKSVIISSNQTSVDIDQLGEGISNRENILIFQNDTVQLADYFVTYKGKRKEGVNLYYEIEYYTKIADKYVYEFTLNPLVQLNKRMGNVAEPDTRHFWHKDIYTHVTYADLETEEKGEDPNEYKAPKQGKYAIGDSIFTSNAIITLDSIIRIVDTEKYNLSENDIAVATSLTVKDINGKTFQAQPLFIIKDTVYTYAMPFEVEELGLKFTFDKILPTENKFEISTYEKNNASKPFVIIKAIQFPLINILWMGSVLLAIGSIIAIRFRLKNS